MRLTKSTYILITLLLSVSFWKIMPIGPFLKTDVIFVLQMIWGILGYLKWGRIISKPLFKQPYTQIPIWIWFAVALSFFAAYYYHEQSFFGSLIASRFMLYYAILWILLIVRPNEKEIIKAFDTFSVLYVLVFLLNSYAPFSVTYEKTDWLIQYKKGLLVSDFVGDEDYGRMLIGIELVFLSLSFRVQQLLTRYENKTFIKVLFFYSIIFLVQNRSNLLPATIIFFYGLFMMKTNNKMLILFFSAIILSVFVYLTFNNWLSLYNESINQLSDKDYNRIKAYNYFLFEANKSWINGLIGNGFLSLNETNLMSQQKENGIYNSDVGFIGIWNYYGIIPVILYVYYTVNAFFTKSIPFYVKAMSFHILIGFYSVSHFISNNSITLWFLVYIYLFVYYKENNIIFRKFKKNNIAKVQINENTHQ